MEIIVVEIAIRIAAIAGIGIAALALLRALDFMSARRWRWQLIHWFAATLILGLLLAWRITVS